MISNRLCLALCLALLLSLPAAFAVAAPDAVKDAPKESVKDSSKPVVPDALSRSAVDNYKDMLLARCIAQAYQAEPRAFADARASAGAMADWINVDPKDSSAVMDQLMTKRPTKMSGSTYSSASTCTTARNSANRPSVLWISRGVLARLRVVNFEPPTHLSAQAASLTSSSSRRHVQRPSEAMLSTASYWSIGSSRRPSTR